MREWGYGAGYDHAHRHADAMTSMQCLPDSLVNARFYLPTDRGAEKRIAERLEEIRKAKSDDAE
jgi:putative ATPase